jgi:hypothetical protein
MPFKSEDRLKLLIDDALNDQEIAQGIKDAQLSRNNVINSLVESSSEIWAVAVDDINGYDILEKEVFEIKKTNPTYFSNELQITISSNNERIITLAIFSSSLAFVILLTIAITLLEGQNLFTANIQTIKYASIILLSLVLVFFTLTQRNQKLKNSWLSLKDEIERKRNFAAKERQLIQSEDVINNTVLEKAIKSYIRGIINLHLAPQYKTTLDNLEAPGLSEVLNISQTINTQALSKLNFLFNNMPGGSIGIAGPRGAGKTTLIQNYCSSQRTVSEIKGKKILPVFTSAPVEYDTRDFILHLYSSTCKSFLRLVDPNDNVNSSARPGTTEVENKFAVKKILQPIADICYSASLLLFTFGIAIAIGKRPELWGISSSFRADILIRANVSAVPLLKWSLVTLVITYFFQKAQHLSWFEYLKAKWPWIYFFKFMRDFSPIASNAATDSKTARESSLTNENSSLIEGTRLRLQKIKFQQTFTSGWSGALKSPIGIEGGITNGVTFAEKPMSNPEIIYEFTQFLNWLPSEYLIIIGIDELDKLESDLQAHKFLNEIKSIFGVPRCFYLISVSENAMSNFERRGLPIRDVFDSSFDNIVYVDYLTPHESTNLLSRRVIGKPMPFFYLSYCISGGLPRDLIRAFRQIIEIGQRNIAGNSLASITNYIVSTEVNNKVRAANAVVKNFDKLTESIELSQFLFDLQNQVNSGDELFDSLIQLNKWHTRIKLNPPYNEDLKALKDGLMAFFNEFFTYLLWMQTLDEFFGKYFGNSEDALKKGYFVQLAAAKQAMAINPFIARKAVSEFRRANNMEAIPDLFWDISTPLYTK